MKNLSKKRIQAKQERLNLVPVMDAVFIFIFFLLFSAKFIKIFEIETQSPVTREISSEKQNGLDPLNLKVWIDNKSIVITKGINDIKIYSQDISIDLGIENESKIHIKNILLNLRKEYPKDDYAIVIPKGDVSYETIIQIIEIIQELPHDHNGRIELNEGFVKLNKIFSQVVLEPLK
jgi:biopolymer transport protein ExbD